MAQDDNRRAVSFLENTRLHIKLWLALSVVGIVSIAVSFIDIDQGTTGVTVNEQGNGYGVVLILLSAFAIQMVTFLLYYDLYRYVVARSKKQ
jgi:uncharacterized membrane-anchored protein